MEYIREHVYQYKVALEDINIFCGDFGLYESWNKQLRFYGDEYIKAGYFQNWFTMFSIYDYFSSFLMIYRKVQIYSKKYVSR